MPNCPDIFKYLIMRYLLNYTVPGKKKKNTSIQKNKVCLYVIELYNDSVVAVFIIPVSS